MEKQFVFERLANSFSKCQVEIRRGKTPSDGDIPNVLYTAGRTLFATISLKEIDLGDTPDWFAIEPEGTSPHHGGICYSWDLYWLTAIEWLAKNKPDSGITFPSDIIHPVSLETRLYSGCDIYDILHLLHRLRLSDKHLKRAWRRLAKASEDACSYLADMMSSKLEPDTKATIAAILISLLIICVFVLSVWLIPFTPFTWLKNHPNSYGLQGSVIFLILSFIVGLSKSQWRKWCWGTAVMAFLMLILSLLGGRSSR